MSKYVDGYVLPVPKKSVDAYRRMAEQAGHVWREHGALEYTECIAEDVKPGEVTSFPASREAQGRQDRGVRMDRLRVARAAGHGQCRRHEGSADREHGSEVPSFRRQTHVLGWFRVIGQRLVPRFRVPAASPAGSLVSHRSV